MDSSDPHQGAQVLVAGPPLAESQAAAVLIHGRGAGAMDIMGLASEFALNSLPFLAPEAAGRTWYPHSFLAPIQANEPHLSSALNLIGGIMDTLQDAGITAENTALIGFSQGACLSIEYAARHPKRYGAIGVFSGGLIGPQDQPLSHSGDLAGTPVFLGCSDIDMHIPESRVRETAEILGQMNAQVDCRIYPGMGHTVVADEIEAVRDLIAALVPQPKSQV
jgi:predicted esterase